MSAKKPHILVIDDQPELVSICEANESVTISIKSPVELEEADLKQAQLVLVDQNLDKWPEKSASPYACRPMDGLALSSIVRSHLNSIGDSPAAVCLFSGELPALTLGEPAAEHLVARAFGLEWAFDKVPNDRRPTLDEQLVALAEAVTQLPRRWPEEDEAVETLLALLLDLPDEDWQAHAWSDVEKARPPLHDLSLWTDGLALLRWLLQRILPYPCFLSSSTKLAQRLQVTPEWFSALTEKEEFRTQFDAIRFRGILAGFAEPLWWNAGLEWLLAQALGEKTQPTITEIHNWLGSLAGEAPSRPTLSQPVVAYDANRQIEGVYEMDECLMIQPDDWPSYADDCWVRVALARESRELRRLVISRHKFRLEEPES